MFPFSNRFTAATGALLVSCAALVAIPGKALAAPYGTNLVVNGNAEAGAASTTGASGTAPFWTVGPAFTVVPYGAPGFPTLSQGPPDGMNQFFAGGQDATVSTATQNI